ncbi:MAG: glycoside hydrolase family 2 TIM barrel-domain containing protein [Candidatus Coatesbacteria bacterium]
MARQGGLSLLAIIFALGVNGGARGSDGVREDISLNGKWEHVVVPAKSDNVPAEGWKEFTVPGTVWLGTEAPGKYLWLRREVEIPDKSPGCRFFVDVRGAKYDPHVYVDGVLAGFRLEGFSPFEVEITGLVKPGGRHRIGIRCRDHGVVFSRKESSKGKFLAPVGGYKNPAGPFGDILLRIRPPVRLVDRDLVIVTSTRKGTITVTGRVDGGGGDGLMVDAVVLDGGKERLRLDAGRVGPGGEWTIAKAFPDARCWSPEAPHLYHLGISLRRGGDLVDAQTIRFGFKEIWTEGPDFYLNGVKRHLLASSTWPVTQPQSDEEIRRNLETMRAGNVCTFRLHTEPWPARWLDIADEVGVMIVDEAAVYTDTGSYAYSDHGFWENYRTHLAELVRRDRNHACLALWSLGNEIMFMGNARTCPDLEKKLAELGRFVKGIDPHHPVTFEADLDPGGSYDVIGLHYPWELPNQHAYPVICDWLGSRVQTEAGGGMLGQRSTGFLWERKKPLYIGEYLWVPIRDYSAGSVFFGDEAYLNRGEHTDRARVRAWTDQTLAYRRSGVSAMCPWSAFDFGGRPGKRRGYDEQKEFYRRVAAYLRTRDNRVFAGEKATLEFDVFNDSAKTLSLELRLLRAGKTVASATLVLEPAGYRPVSLAVEAPPVKGRKVFALEAVLLADGDEVHRAACSLGVEPKTELAAPAGTRLVTYDPAGTWPGSVKSLDGLAGVDSARTVLVVAPNALGKDSGGGVPVIGGTAFDTAAFTGFLRSGGRAVVLEQETLGPLGMGLRLVEHGSTMTFPLNPRHPLLEGIGAGDLAFWRGDLYVARRQVVRPESAGGRAIVVSGGPSSLDQAAVVEFPAGKGRLVLVQALVGGKYGTEPAARRLLANAVAYLARWRPPRRDRTLLLGDDDAFAARLSSVGVEFERAAGSLRPSGLAGVGLLILEGGGEGITGSREAVAGFVRSGGGRIYWHRPGAEAFRALGKALGASELEMRETRVATALRARESALLDGVSREDVTYTTRPAGWERNISPVMDAADRVFVPSRRGRSGGRSYPAGVFSLSGGEPRTAGNRSEAWFNRRGNAVVRVRVGEPGLYPVTVAASGTARDGVFPAVLFCVNGVIQGGLTVDAAAPQGYEFVAGFAAGENALEIAFVNGSEWGGGRELALGPVEVGPRLRYPPGSEVLVSPGAVVAMKTGDTTVVLDGMNWDRDGDNAVRGRRYATALLAGLEAGFPAPSGRGVCEALPLGAFRLTGESPYSSVSGSGIALRSAGRVEAGFECARAGAYGILVTGNSTPAGGEYAKLRFSVDGRELSTTELVGSGRCGGGPVTLEPGRHRMAIEFINDAIIAGEDRNLFIDSVGMCAGW